MNIKQIHDDINKAMQEIAEKHGMICPPNTLRYSDSDCKVQVQLVKARENTNSTKATGHDPIKMGWARPGDKAIVILRGVRQEVVITKNTGRGKYHFQDSLGRPMAGPYALFTQVD